MEKKYEWLRYYRKNKIKDYWNTVMMVTKLKKNIPSKFKRTKIDAHVAQEYIADCIKNKKPIMVSRFGCFESKCLGEGFGILYGSKKKYTKSCLYSIHNNAGVFPYGKDGANQFFEITRKTLGNIDLLGVWTTNMHDYLVDIQCSKTMQITNLDNLEPFRFKNPWTKALEGKKVVVVHPFQESIEMQYRKRELLFENNQMLPEFDLRVVKAVQTIAGQLDDRFSDWGEALTYMYNECVKEDFDVAIIGCGAYGMPLASMLKNAGKVAIHLGGATQIMFGIKGGRWDNNSIASLYNDYWVRPSESEKPEKANNVEQGCYW